MFAADLAQALDALGHVSTVASLRRSASSATVAAHPIADGHWLRGIRGLRRLARGHDVVVAHGSTTLPASAIACTGIVPFIYRSIGDPAYWSASRLKQLQTTMLLNRATAVVTLFPAATETLRHRGVTAHLATIPNAVSSDDFPFVTDSDRRRARAELGLPLEARIVLYLGALSPEKRPERAVALGSSRPDLRVLVVGDGPLRRRLEAQAARVDNVDIHGPTSRPQQFLASADVVIVPSDTEGIPAVAVEAGLSGVPVVASDVGGLADVVDHGATGLLVAVGDGVALSAAVDRALACGASMGSAARGRCLERFDIEPVARQWAEVIKAAARPRTGT